MAEAIKRMVIKVKPPSIRSVMHCRAGKRWKTKLPAYLYLWRLMKFFL